MVAAAQPKRAMLWFESHLGAGDARLTFNLAEGLARNGYEVTLVSSSNERWAHMLKPSGHIHVVDLPALDRRQDKKYYTPEGALFPDDEAYVQKRTEALLGAFEQARPDVVITQGWPLSRNQFDAEMLALTRAVQAAPNKPLLSTFQCDANFINTEPSGFQKNRKAQFMEELKAFDSILVPGDQMLDFIKCAPVLKPFADKVQYTGYMVEEQAGGKGYAGPEVVVCSGGGWHDADLAFYKAAIHARKDTLAKDATWRVKVNQKLCSPEAYERIVAAARAEDPSGQHIIVEANDEKYPVQMLNAKLLICRSGYNTLTEAVDARKAIVTCPRPYKGSDREQQARAEALEKLGHVQCITHPQLEAMQHTGDYGSMVQAIDHALQKDLSEVKALATDGADQAAQLLSHMMAERVPAMLAVEEVPGLEVRDVRGGPALQSAQDRQAGVA